MKAVDAYFIDDIKQELHDGYTEGTELGYYFNQWGRIKIFFDYQMSNSRVNVYMDAINEMEEMDIKALVLGMFRAFGFTDEQISCGFFVLFD